MSFDTDWDVDAYFDENEPEAHWELRRNFIIANKDKYPEDRLVALAKVYTNVEILGCKYGRKVMDRVKELSANLSDDFQQHKKDKIQRTFVSWEDAAKSRASGSRDAHTLFAKTEGSYVTLDHCKRKIDDDVDLKDDAPTTKVFIAALESEANPDLELMKKARAQAGWKGKLVLMQQRHDMPLWTILTGSANSCGVQCEVKKFDDDKFGFVLGTDRIASSDKHTRKDAREELSEAALKIIQRHCFMIKRKKPLTETDDTLTIDRDAVSQTNRIAGEKLDDANNVGAKMMKLMGWGGKGLGKDEAGREDIVTVEQRVSRVGIGSGDKSEADVKNKLREIIRDYARGENIKNLVFSTDFSKDERAFVHQMAQRFNLKSHSQGKKDDRQVIVSRKITAWEIVEELVLNGDRADDYELIRPSEVE